MSTFIVLGVLAVGIVMVSLLLLVSVSLSMRYRLRRSLRRDDLADLREEVAILRARMNQLQEEVECLKPGGGLIRSSGIQEG